jgi:arylsulfatase A-like enzyme/Tfp pilus assembly protein PilF
VLNRLRRFGDNRRVTRFGGILLLLLTACSRSAPPAPIQKPSVLLITIDTLRADRVGRGLTPAIDGLAARGVRFTAARSTAPLTLPSHTSIMTGTLPPENGVRVNGVALAARPTLAEAFHNAGYRTGAFVGAYVLDRRFGLSAGFDTYDDRVQRDPSGAARLDAERRGDIVADAALQWLRGGRGRPFFAWIHFYDPHAPYDPPQEFLAKAGGNAYDGEVAFADAQVARVLDWLRASGEAGRTIVAVTGDHGEGLGDHGELTHGMLAYDSTLRVPLVIAVPPGLAPPKGGSHAIAGFRLSPSREALRRTAAALAAAGQAEGSVDGPVSLADLAGTLLHAAGVPVPAGMREGPLGGSAEAYAETEYPRTAGWHDVAALAFDRWKLVLSSAAELYDVTSDPAESRNLASEKPAVVEGARNRLMGLHTATAAAPAAVPSDAADRLRALGYVSGAAAPANDAAPNPAKQIAAWNTFERELTRLSDGDARGALPGLARLARAYPDAAVFQTTYARALKDTGRAAQAVETYRRLVARWPGNAAMYHDLAVAAAAAGMPAEVARAEQAALTLEPANAAASNGLGLILIEQGDRTEALKAFERAVKDDPTNATFWTNLGNARRDAGETARAEQAYRQALEADPRSADAANGLGVLLVQAHRAPEAIRWFDQALAGSPTFTEARLNLGIAYQESGNREKASETYRRVLAEASPGSKQHRAAADLLASLARR